MKVYLLWFHEWENSSVLGVFETYEKAESWKKYFIANPTNIKYSCDMLFYADTNGYSDRFIIDERVADQLADGLAVDNLKFLEFCEGKTNV